jgi:hypothetical protein
MDKVIQFILILMHFFADHICIAVYIYTSQRAFVTMHGAFFLPKINFEQVAGVS